MIITSTSPNRLLANAGIKGSTDRVCSVEFEDSRQAIQWIADHQVEGPDDFLF